VAGITPLNNFLGPECAETKPEPSSRTGRRCSEQRRTWKQEQKLDLFPAKIPFYREDRDTTVLSPSVTNSVSSHCITLILLGQTINLLGEWQTQENWGLFAHQPPIGLQYSTICSTNNTIPRTRLACTRLHLDRPRPALLAHVFTLITRVCTRLVIACVCTRHACARLHRDRPHLHTPCLHASSP
jgi:hypothetical protein